MGHIMSHACLIGGGGPRGRLFGCGESCASFEAKLR